MNYLKLLLGTLFLFVLLQVSDKANAHCEVPCGIYNDSARVQMLYEHIATIEKAMIMIKKLQKQEKPNYNQLLRWVMTKEKHANDMQHIIYQYFMTQRIKFKPESNKQEYKKYIEQITLAHKILVYAMKSKQTTEESYIKQLRETVHLFEHSYFNKQVEK